MNEGFAKREMYLGHCRLQTGILEFFLKYEGRSINKLQNGAIPLILKIGKIRNICFVGNLILRIHRNFSDDDVTVTSFINVKYGDVAVEVVP